MNIFRTSDDPDASAAALDDARVVKMTLETAQILSTVLRKAGVNDPLFYKPTHPNHPCTLWAGETRDNFGWLLCHGLYLVDEYRYRFGRRHASAVVMDAATLADWGVLPPGAESPQPFCGPDDLLPGAPVTERYRALLRAKWRDGKRPPRWTWREPPEWKETEK